MKILFLKPKDKSVAKLKSGKLFGFGTSPEQDWKIIFIFFALLSGAAVLMGFLIFTKIDKREIFTFKKGEVSADQTINIELLRKTVSYYETKEAEFQKLLGN